MECEILVTCVHNRRPWSRLITLYTNKVIEELTLEDFTDKSTRYKIKEAPKVLNWNELADHKIYDVDWIEIQDIIEDEFISNHTLTKTCELPDGYWGARVIAPLIRLQDSENSKDMCLVLMRESRASSKILLSAIPIAQLCLWAGEKEIQESRFKITGEKIEFLGWSLLDSNSYFHQFMDSIGLFEFPEDIEVEKLIVDRNNTLIGTPSRKVATGSTPTVKFIDLEKVNRVGLLSTKSSENYITVIINWQHLTAYDLHSIALNSILMLNLDTTEVGMKNQLNILNGINILSYKISSELYSYKLFIPDIAVKAEDIVNNLRSMCQLTEYEVDFRNGIKSIEPDTLGGETYVLIDSTVPFVDGQTTLVMGGSEGYKALNKKFNRLYEKYGDNPVKHDEELNIKNWTDFRTGFLLALGKSG